MECRGQGHMYSHNADSKGTLALRIIPPIKTDEQGQDHAGDAEI